MFRKARDTDIDFHALAAHMKERKLELAAHLPGPSPRQRARGKAAPELRVAH